ncbi:MAG: HEAT repeat domain-containing protein [Phycisphaerae bacterium]|nr:HEAT repeat domain-containing protein [Phycisphaerae bacterium]
MHIPTLAVVLVFTLAAIAMADPPDFTTPVCSQPAVTDLKVVNDRWPDASSARQFALDAIRLENAKTDQEKAIAVWLWIRRFTMYTNGTAPSELGPKGRVQVLDPIKILNVWGAHWCDGLAQTMALCWRHLGYPAQKFYKSGHTLCDAGWTDADGVFRYHLFDVSEGWFAFTRDGKRIASAEDLVRDHSLAYRPAVGPMLRTHSLNSLYGWVHAMHQPYKQTHKMELELRGSDQIMRQWGGLDRMSGDRLPAFQDNVGRRGDNVPEEHGAIPVDYGIGSWDIRVDLSEEGIRREAFLPPTNCKSELDESGNHVIQADLTRPAVLTYRILTPYIISKLGVVVDQSETTIELSCDGGKTWRSFPFERRVGPWFGDDGAKLAPATKDGKEISAFGRYDVLVRVSLLKGELERLAFLVGVQQNIYSLPQLLPGENRITISGKLAKGRQVEVAYNWFDAQKAIRLCTAKANTLPYTYSIHVDGKRWGEIKSDAVIIQSMRDDGRGNRVEQTGDNAAVGKIDPLPSYRVSLGKKEVPPLKTLDEYLATLKRSIPATPGPVSGSSTGVPPVSGIHGQDARATTMPAVSKNELSEALAGVRVIAFQASNARGAGPSPLPSPRGEGEWGKAYEAVREVAMKNLDRPKLEALQVMYWLDRKRAIPEFVKIVREEEPAIWYLADEELDPKKVDVIEDDRDPKSVRRGHYFNVVAVLSRFLADEKNTDALPALIKAAADQKETRDEPRRAVLRSLGEIGDKRAVPVLLKYAAADADDAEIAVEALGRLGDPAGIPLARKAAENGYTPLQANGIRALGLLGDRESVPLLRRMLTNGDEDARGAAAEALGRLGDTESLDAIAKAAEAEPVAWAKEAMAKAMAKLRKK